MDDLKGGDVGDKDVSIYIIPVPNIFSALLKISVFFDKGHGIMDSSPWAKVKIPSINNSVKNPPLFECMLSH